MSSSRRPRAIVCDAGASTIALTTRGLESTSPYPVTPASVETRMMSASRELSVRASSKSGMRR